MYINLVTREKMMKRKFVLAFFAYIVVVFVIATVWHLVLFREVYLNANLRTEPIFQLGILSILIQAAIVAYLYPKIVGEGSPVKEGLKFGLLLAFLLGSYGVLAEAGKYDIGTVSTFLFYEGAFFLIQYIFVGMVIGVIYGKHLRS